MDRAAQVKLLNDCLSLADAQSTKLSDEAFSSPLGRYLDNNGSFDKELDRIFRQSPAPYVHSSQIAEPNSFVTLDTPSGSLLVTRDEHGQSHIFHNVCRHRGTQLVEEAQGCARRFRCPYHAWTYTPQGNLSSVPHKEQSFPALDTAAMGLKEIPSVEKYGFVWLLPAGGGEVVLDHYLGGLGADLTWLEVQQLLPFTSTTRIWNSHWKLIADGGLESYHFRFAHRDTIAPYFFDNLSTYEQFGHHTRTVLPRTSLLQLKQEPEHRWSLREHTHLVYALFPMTTLLVQHRHIDWIHATPLSPEQTQVTVVSLVPRPAQGLDWSAPEHELWQFNHDITRATLDEDFSLAQSIQKGLKSGVNREFLFGRNEGALNQLHATIDKIMGA